MTTDSNSLKWLHFSGKSEDFPTWSTRFIAFMQTKGLYKTLIGEEDRIVRPRDLEENASEEQRAAHNAQQEQYRVKVEEKTNRNNTVWCYLALTLDSTTLMTIRHDCVNADGMGDGQAAWKAVMDRFRSNEAPTVVSIVAQLARLKLTEGEDIQSFFIRAQELYSRLQQAGEYLSPAIFNALILNGLPEQYEHFIVQESFNPSGDYTELRKRLLNYSIGKEQRLGQSAGHVAMPSKSFSRASRSQNNKKDGKRVLTCYVCGIAGHIAKDCRKKDIAFCSHCKQKGHFEKACKEKGKSLSGGPNQSLASLCAKSFTFEENRNNFVIDSGSTDHIVSDKSVFADFQEKHDIVLSPNGGQSEVKGLGSVEIEAYNTKNQKVRLLLKDVLYVPQYKFNLLSIDKILEKGHSILFKEQSASLKLCSSQNYFDLERKDRLFFLRADFVKRDKICSSVKTEDSELWHKRLGHLNMNDVRKTIPTLKACELGVCEVCAMCKITKVPLPKETEVKSKKPLERVFVDILGPLNPASVHGYRYVLMLVDEYSKFKAVKFLRVKSEALEKFKEFVAEQGCPKTLRSDNGTEFTNKNFKNFCTENRIRQEFTVPETPEQNGMAERANRTIVEMARCLLLDAKLPKTYWLRAIATASHLRNLVVTESGGLTPFESFTGRKPHIEKLKVFGCTVFVQKRKNLRQKLDQKASKCKFLGYDEHSPGYVVQDMSTGKVFVARNVIFNEKEVPSFKTGEEIDFADFDDSSLSAFRQNPTNLNNGIEPNEVQMGPPDLTVGHEANLEEVKDEPVEAEIENVPGDSALSEEVAITQNTQNFDRQLEPIVVPRQITGSDLQQVVTQRDLRCTTSTFLYRLKLKEK